MIIAKGCTRHQPFRLKHRRATGDAKELHAFAFFTFQAEFIMSAEKGSGTTPSEA